MEVQVLSSAQKVQNHEQRKEETLSEALVKPVLKLVGSDLGIFDDSNPGKRTLRAESVFDITPLRCWVDDKQKLIRYAWKSDGTLVVQLLTCIFRGLASGPRTNFFISKKVAEIEWCDGLAKNPEFVICCKNWGVVETNDVKKLAEIIFEKAPKEALNGRG